MTEKEILDLGFNFSLDTKGEKVSYHPEGISYYKKIGDFLFSTTSNYNYLWVSYKGESVDLISRNLSKKVLNIAMSFKKYSDIKFINENN
jgi:hypothetical protein